MSFINKIIDDTAIRKKIWVELWMAEMLGKMVSQKSLFSERPEK